MKLRLLKIFFTICLIAYLVLLTKLIVFKYPDAMMLDILRDWSLDGFRRHLGMSNIIPFRTIGSSLFNTQLRVEVTTLIYNILAFVPLGILLPYAGRRFKSWLKTLVAGLVVSLWFEFVQLVTILGAADVDDVILNVTGTLMGYVGYRLLCAVRLAPSY
jgi:glycopeptide antibiotics resistance protein